MEWSPPDRHPGGCGGLFGVGGRGQGVQDGHVFAVRLTHTSLAVLESVEGWRDTTQSHDCTNSSHPLRSLTIILGIHCDASWILLQNRRVTVM